MSAKEIKVIFNFNQQNDEFICKSNEKIENVCKKFTYERAINFNSVFFLVNGKKLFKEDYKKTIAQLAYGGILNLLVIENNTKSEESLILKQNKNASVIFWFNSYPVGIQCLINTKIDEVCISFSNKIGKDFYSLDFYYRNSKLDFTKTFADIASREDIIAKKIEIYVEENRNIIKENYLNYEEKFTCNKKLILIIVILVILIIIIVFIVILFKVILKKEDDEGTVDYNERCSSYNKTSLIEECLTCKDGFDLYKGECIPYAFYVIYHVDYYFELVQLFNHNKKADLLAMKIDNNIINPESELNFESIGNKTVYFYINETNPISLSYMFENITKLIDFSFNNNYINNFNIINLKGMFSGCRNLKKISFGQFRGDGVTDISYLFSCCDALLTASFSKFNPKNLEKMNNLFYNCSSLNNVDLSSVNTKNVINMSMLFYNCKSINSLVFSNFDTQNLIDISMMFYNCTSLEGINTKHFITKNVINLSGLFYNCNSLKSLDITNFDTHNVKNMSHMFYNCSSLNTLNVRHFNILNVFDISGMFSDCLLLTSLDLSNFNTKNINNPLSIIICQI